MEVEVTVWEQAGKQATISFRPLNNDLAVEVSDLPEVVNVIVDSTPGYPGTSWPYNPDMFGFILKWKWFSGIGTEYQ